MNEEQKALLTAMHTIKNYCQQQEVCTHCALTKNGVCPFTETTPCDWAKLKPLKEVENNWSVFE